MNDTIYPPELNTIFDVRENQVFANLNCIQVGKIDSYDISTQSASVQIQVKRRIGEDEIIDYPLLVECPVIVLQGGGAFLEMPIEPGDFCLILFNDRDIDNWYLGGNNTEPNTRRKHNLSDGFVLVGVNPSIQARNLDGDNVNLWGPGESDRIQIQSDGSMEIGAGGNPAARQEDPTISTAVEDAAFWAWVTAITAAVNAAHGAGLVPPTQQAGKIQTGSSEVTIK